MTPQLSTRAFKFLRKISRKSGLQHTDDEVHDIGVRLLSLCNIAANAKKREAEHLQTLLTELEIKALRVLREQYADTGRVSSVRELSRALGYQSSRSGHDQGGYRLAVELHAQLPGIDRAQAQRIMDEAHKTCPYSKALRGDISVKLVAD